MSINWNVILDKPETFPPSEHEHNLVTADKAGFLGPEDFNKIENIKIVSTEDIETLCNEIFKE